MKSHKGSNVVTQTAVTHRDAETPVTHKDLEKKLTITHEEEKIALILSLTGIFTVWYLYRSDVYRLKLLRKIESKHTIFKLRHFFSRATSFASMHALTQK